MNSETWELGRSAGESDQAGRGTVGTDAPAAPKMLGFDVSSFDGSRDGRSCAVEYHADIVPLHRFDLPNAPVTAWKVRILGGGVNALGEGGWVEWYGERHENRADAMAELATLTGAAA
ncbi:hypothetical protein [Microbacterium sp. USHLN272]|uniref:hypothetical protein n=1 Tax=Microbacterium sp. USHLN272 TaxID=3081287 RepID=UPI0030160237